MGSEGPATGMALPYKKKTALTQVGEGKGSKSQQGPDTTLLVRRGRLTLLTSPGSMTIEKGMGSESPRYESDIGQTP